MVSSPRLWKTWPKAVATTLLTVAMTLLAPSARCQGRKVVGVEADSRVLTALDVALTPWSLSVGPAPGEPPEGDLESACARARAIAAEQGAGAVVWIAKARGPDETRSLCVYDAQTGQLVVRPLTVAPPLNDAAAAAIALSVKTILRSSPLSEVEAPAPAVVPLAPRTVPPVPVAPEQPAPPQVRETASVWRLEAIVGARTPTGTGNLAEPRAALGLSAWPQAFGGHFALGAVLEAGPGVPIDSAGGGRSPDPGPFSEASFEASAPPRPQAGRRAGLPCQAVPRLFLSRLALVVFWTP